MIDKFKNLPLFRYCFNPKDINPDKNETNFYDFRNQNIVQNEVQLMRLNNNTVLINCTKNHLSNKSYNYYDYDYDYDYNYFYESKNKRDLFNIDQINDFNNSQYKTQVVIKNKYLNNFINNNIFNMNGKLEQIADLIKYYYYNFETINKNNTNINNYILRKSWIDNWLSSIKYKEIKGRYITTECIIEHIKKIDLNYSFEVNKFFDFGNNKFLDKNQFVKIDNILYEKFKKLYPNIINEVINMNEIICIEIPNKYQIYYKNNSNFNIDINKLYKNLRKDIYDFFLCKGREAKKIFKIDEDSFKLEEEDIFLKYNAQIVKCYISKDISRIIKEINLIKNIDTKSNNKKFLPKSWLEYWKEKIDFENIKNERDNWNILNKYFNCLPKIKNINFTEICVDKDSFLNDVNEKDKNKYIIPNDKIINVNGEIVDNFIRHYGIDIKYDLLKIKIIIKIIFHNANFECYFYSDSNIDLDNFNKIFISIINNKNNDNKIRKKIIHTFKLNIPIESKNFEFKKYNNEIHISFIENDISQENKTNNYSQKICGNNYYKNAINKDWIERWKRNRNYQYINLGEIKNKDILYDINSFLNDGNENSIENKILKEETYDIISKEQWESFKKYGYDEEIDSEIINYNNTLIPINLVFLYNDQNYDEEIKKYKTIMFIDKEENIISKIVKCLNLRNNDISKEICRFYNYNKEFLCNDFIQNNNLGNNKYVISFVNQNIHNYNNNINRNTNNNNDNSFNNMNINKNLPLVGLKNLGVTCFMNSVLQIFNNIKIFGDYISILDLEKDNCPITKALQKVIFNLRNPGIKKCFKPTEFNNIISYYNSKFLKNSPNDSRQLIQFIMESVHNELNKNKGNNYYHDDNSDETKWKEKLEFEKRSFNFENKSIIIDLFYGIQGNETYCLKCGNTSYVFEHFNILNLPIFKKNNNLCLQDMINDYTKENIINGKNENYCLKCQDFSEAKLKHNFYKLPGILIICPGRKNKGIKYNIEINFEEKIKIKLSQNIGGKEIEYNLIGIIYHYGAIGYIGHNIAYCKRNNIWYEFDDDYIRKIDINDISGKGILLFIYQNDEEDLKFNYNLKNNKIKY